MTQIKLTKSDQKAIEMFTADMSKIINELSETLREVFLRFRKEECGSQVGEITLRLFDEWLIRNLLPELKDIVKITVREIARTESIEDVKANLAKKLSPFNNVEEYVVNVVAAMKTGKSAEESSKDSVWQILEVSLENFLVQTATLIAGRILMHLVGADKNAWSEIQVQKGMDNPYLSFYWTIRRQMSGFLPTIYALNELDWLYVPDIKRESIKKQSQKALRLLEMRVDKSIGTTHQIIKEYNYGSVDLDIWKAVYQDFLSPEDINRLGFVTTPDEIVDLILDVANYTENSENLCKCKVLDPACGSGTFLVESLSRLRKHLEADMRCHENDGNQTSWQLKKKMLEMILFNINGIDINPFAVFLTTMNLTFQVIDVYSEVKHKYPDFSLLFNIATHDSLVEKPPIEKINSSANSRLQEAIRRSKKYSDLCDKKFDLVTGNPPWGAVLRGAVGPLGDEKKREFYKTKYESARGKYDYYVLFMERGIDWLTDGGLLAMITQVTYVSQAFGDGIKKVIKKQGSCETFIDVSRLGHMIFPKWTNYPAITTLRRGGRQKKLRLVEVKEI